MERVRDPSIQQWDRVIDGSMKGAFAQNIHEAVSALDASEQDMVRRLVPLIVDTTLHHLLWTLEQVQWVHLAMDNEHTSIRDIRDVAQGDLQGYLYDWAPRLSKERYIPPA
jgi:hypothetical protein